MTPAEQHARDVAQKLLEDVAKFVANNTPYLKGIGNVGYAMANHIRKWNIDAIIASVPVPSEPAAQEPPAVGLKAAAPLLLAACKEFIRKVEEGEARSTRSYKQMKEAVAIAEQPTPAVTVVHGGRGLPNASPPSWAKERQPTPVEPEHRIMKTQPKRDPKLDALLAKTAPAEPDAELVRELDALTKRLQVWEEQSAITDRLRFLIKCIHDVKAIVAHLRKRGKL